MIHAILVGPAGEIRQELEAQGVETTVVEGFANRPALEGAGIVEADLLVLTDVEQATAIPVAMDLNEDVKVVVYAHDTIPEFARGQADLIVDPDLLSATAVAEELAGNGPE